jgi:hypothetical protein
MLDSKLMRCTQRGEIDGFKYVLVESARSVGVERHMQNLEGVGEALHPDAYGSVAHVGRSGFF